MPLVLLSLLLGLGQGNEAEKQFRAMEKKLAAAKTLQVRMDVLMEGGKGEGKFKGELALAEGNKARFELKGEISGKPMEMEMVSNGTRLKQSMTPPGKTMEREAQKNLNSMILGGFQRAGMFAGTFLVRAGKPLGKEGKLDEFLRVSDFKLGKKEKVGQREAQVIEYKLSVADGASYTVSLWLDTQTQLPLQRILSEGKEGEGLRLTETYTDLQLDAAIDAKRFELPK